LGSLSPPLSIAIPREREKEGVMFISFFYFFVILKLVVLYYIGTEGMFFFISISFSHMECMYGKSKGSAMCCIQVSL
jgi:hypothetical protein